MDRPTAPAGPADNSLVTSLPGPSRRRNPQPYRYRLLYRNPEERGRGCVLLWEVGGGRMAYQIALERSDAGQLRLHCTCADHVYRADEPGHVCKHVRGLMVLTQGSAAALAEEPLPRSA